MLISCSISNHLWHDNCHNVAQIKGIKENAHFLVVKIETFVRKKYHGDENCKLLSHKDIFSVNRFSDDHICCFRNL